IGRIISSTLKIEEVYEGFAKEVRKLIPFDKISINIVDFENNTVTLPYVTGKPVAERNVKDVFPLAGSLTEAVIKQKKGIIFHPVNEDEVASRFPGHLPVYRAGLQSAMMVPLISRGQAIATMNFISESANAYTEEYLRLAEKVANQIAGAVANAQLYKAYGQTLTALEKSEKEARALAKENEIIANIGRIISSTLDINKVYKSFGEEVHKVIPFNRIAITLIDYERRVSHTAYQAGVYVPGRGPEDVFPLQGSFTEEVMRQRKGVLIHSENGKELIRRFPGLAPVWKSGFRSFIGIPLISQGKVIGVLHIYSLKTNAYQEAQLDFGQRVGNQIAGAIANAQLFAEHERLEKERMALEEQFRQAQKMEAVGRLAGGIAHDFNNSLTMIKVAAQLAEMDMNGDSSLKEKLKIIIEATDKSANLARQLLAFSRKQVMEMKVIDLNLLLKELDKMLHRVIGEEIEINYSLAEDLKKVKVDPGQIEQVILNLALNAKDAMPNGGKLVIETANVELDDSYVRLHKGINPGQYVLLSVSDTGIGMTPEVKEHIFEPFFTTKAKGKGTGLGLSTVYGIVKQSGGHIWVYSEPGKGATFKIYLPAVDEPAEEIKRRETEARIPMGKETILIVEDNEEVRKLAGQILERLGYRVISAGEVKEALDVCDKYKDPIHLLLTDVVMPGMSGRNLAEAIAILRPEIKVLYMSGYPDEVIADLGVLKPGINYLHKPFTVESLAKKVREVLDEKK
ncbi:MAG: GAF domain-containing protein, partial [bacterium]